MVLPSRLTTDSWIGAASRRGALLLCRAVERRERKPTSSATGALARGCVLHDKFIVFNPQYDLVARALSEAQCSKAVYGMVVPYQCNAP
jgi:hypothetical protein